MSNMALQLGHHQDRPDGLGWWFANSSFPDRSEPLTERVSFRVWQGKTALTGQISQEELRTLIWDLQQLKDELDWTCGKCDHTRSRCFCP